MGTPTNPIRRRREALGIERSALAKKAGIRLENLLMVEGGGHILLSRPLAAKLSQALGDSSATELIEEYDEWKRAAAESAKGKTWSRR